MRASSRIVATLIVWAIVATQAVLAQDRPRISVDLADTAIPRNSKVYIIPNDGFEHYLAAALRKKSVPLLIVTDRDVADFEIQMTHEKVEASAARIFVWGLLQPSASASIQVVNLKTKVVVYADSSYRVAALRGERSTAEKLAKYLKRKMEKDEKKIKAISPLRGLVVNPTTSDRAKLSRPYF